MSPPLTLVQSAPQSMHPDTRASEALHRAIDAAGAVGYDRGEYAGYLTGWRSGVACGACWGTLLVLLLAGGLRHLGWL